MPPGALMGPPRRRSWRSRSGCSAGSRSRRTAASWRSPRARPRRSSRGWRSGPAFRSRVPSSALLWPDRPDAQGRGSLRQALASIRRVFEEAGAPGPSAGGDAVALDTRGVSVDVARLEAALSAASSPRRSRCTAARSSRASRPWRTRSTPGSTASAPRSAGACSRRSAARWPPTARSRTSSPSRTQRWRSIRRSRRGGARARVLVARGDRAGALREYERCREALRREPRRARARDRDPST